MSPTAEQSEAKADARIIAAEAAIKQARTPEEWNKARNLCVRAAEAAEQILNTTQESWNTGQAEAERSKDVELLGHKTRAGKWSRIAQKWNEQRDLCVTTAVEAEKLRNRPPTSLTDIKS